MDKILIYCLNPYITRSSLADLIKKLSKKNKVYLITSNDTLSLQNYNYFLNLEKLKTLSKLTIIPSFWNYVGLNNIFKFISFYKNSKFIFNFNKYDLVLFCCGYHEIDNFFLNDFYKNKKLVQYLPYHSNNYLIKNYNLCKNFFRKDDLIKNIYLYKTNKKSKSLNFLFEYSIGQIIQKFLDKFFFKFYFSTCLKLIYFLFNKKKSIHKKDFFIKYNFSNSIFLKSICFNKVQKIVGEKLYPQNKFYLANPSYKKIKKGKKNFKYNDMLLLIGWFIGEKDVVNELIKNIKYLKSKYALQSIYIKSHPSFDNNKIIFFSNQIKKVGLKTFILKSSEVVTELKHKFKIIAGFASHALIEANYSFPNSKIICLDKADILSAKFQNPPARIALGSILKSDNKIIFFSELINNKKIHINNKSIYKSELFYINKFLKK